MVRGPCTKERMLTMNNWPIQLSPETEEAIKRVSCVICGRMARASLLDDRQPVCDNCPEWQLAQVQVARPISVPSLFDVARSIVCDPLDPLAIGGKVEW